jgi:hypothetical protein
MLLCAHLFSLSFLSSYVGFDTAQSFSPIFGPPLMVFFAIMANTLLLTILISLLSNTFSIVAQNASEEAMYQHACLTLSGISTDTLFSYMPPLNLLAIVVIMPLSFILTPRWLHKVNIALLRITSWPLLLMIRLCSYKFKRHSNYSSLSNTDSYLETTAEKASHWISWIPLPRSKSNPDRDVIEAAFSRARAKNLSNDDWEEWSASTLVIREGEGTDKQQQSSNGVAGQANLTPHRTNPSTGQSRTAPLQDPHTQDLPEDQREHDSNDYLPGPLSTDSPLAKIYGRARHNTPTRSYEPPSTPKPKQQQQNSKAEANDSGKQREAQFQSEIETLAEKNETGALIRSLMEKMEQQEKAQKRIEDLLELLVGKQGG